MVRLLRISNWRHSEQDYKLQNKNMVSSLLVWVVYLQYSSATKFQGKWFATKRLNGE